MEPYQWTCGWGDADPMGIAYYPRLIDAMHRAGEEFMVELDAAYSDLPELYGIHLPLVAVDSEFKRPVNVRDTLSIEVTVELGTSSLVMTYTARHEDGETAFIGTETHVSVSSETHEKEPLPDELRDILEPFSD